MDQHYTDRVLLAEANQWPEEVVEYFGTGEDEFHMGFHFPVMPRLYMALRRGDRTPVVDIMRRTPPIPDACQWCMFLRNHDELTLEMVTEEERQWMWQEYAPDPRMLLNLGIRRRLAPLVDNDRRRIELLNSLLFTLPGAPIVYYGDEIGMGDNIWLHDRNGVRTPMQWHDGPNAGFSDVPADRLYAPVIDDETYSFQQINVAAQEADEHSLLNTMRHMIGARKQSPVFSRGSLEFLEPEDQAILVYLRRYEDEVLLAVHNLVDEERSARLNLYEFVDRAPYDLLAAATLPIIGPEPYVLTLPPYGYRWLKVAGS
jgi:maltose alpha-D-glucosyltransferase/alpha-amylase